MEYKDKITLGVSVRTDALFLWKNSWGNLWQMI